MTGKKEELRPYERSPKELSLDNKRLQKLREEAKKSLVVLPPPFLAASRNDTSVTQHSRGSPQPHGLFTHSGQIYKMPKINDHAKNYVPVKRPVRGGGGVQQIHQHAIERLSGREEPKPRQSQPSSIVHPDGRSPRKIGVGFEDRLLAISKDDRHYKHRAERNGAAVGKNSLNERYSSLRTVLSNARASLPDKLLESTRQYQPRPHRDAQHTHRQTEHALEERGRLGSFAAANKIYTDAHLLRRMFKKEAEGQASLHKAYPQLVKEARARSTIVTSPRGEDHYTSMTPYH